jgi:hypothetical protein
MTAKSFILGQKIPAPKLRWRHAPSQTFQCAYWKDIQKSEGWVQSTSNGWRALLWLTEIERGKRYATAAEARAAVQQAWEEEWLAGPPLAEGAAKAFLRKVRPTIHGTTVFRSVPEGAWFKDNQGLLCQKRQGLWWSIPNNPDAHSVGRAAHPGYLCYPMTWSMDMIRAARRHYKRHPRPPAGWAVVEGRAKDFIRQLPTRNLPARMVIQIHTIRHALLSAAHRLETLSPHASLDERDSAVDGLDDIVGDLWRLGHVARAHKPKLEQEILDTFDTESDRLVNDLLNQDDFARPEDAAVLRLVADNLNKLT